MKKIFKYLGIIFLLLLLLIISAVLISGGKGYLDAQSDASRLAPQADELISKKQGGNSLTVKQKTILLMVEDPNFINHSGVDFSTPGAGMTTITQSVSKRLAFDQFRPGFAKIRQTGYALGLESRLSKEQILALWLNTLEMGKGPHGWMVGFHQASTEIYGRPPSELTDVEFIRLVAVLISPAAYQLGQNDPQLNERTQRIQKLVSGNCSPTGFSDVWLEGCQS